jgi:hypothetical protein
MIALMVSKPRSLAAIAAIPTVVQGTHTFKRVAKFPRIFLPLGRAARTSN